MIGPAAFPRRVFLQRSLQLTGAALLPIAGAAGCSRTEPAADLETLSASEYAIADAYATTLIPDGGTFEAGATNLELARRLDAYSATERPEVLDGLEAALWAIELAPLLVIQTPSRFTSLDETRRGEYLRALPHSFAPVRLAHLAMRRAFLFLFYNMDETWEPLGYDGPWVLSNEMQP